MKISYHPQTELEELSLVVVEQLSEKFPQTFFVGGYIRNLFLDLPVTDIDIATEATPEQVANILTPVFDCNLDHKNFGVVTIHPQIEITTFRTESYLNSRYPKVQFTTSIEQDSLRRDFTINSLYMSKQGDIQDFHGGLADIGLGLIKFIGDPETRLVEDPTRLLRAIRFMLQLEFKLEQETATAIQNNFSIIEKIKKQFIEAEQNKLSLDLQNEFKKIINSKVLDESFINSYNDRV